MKVIIIIMMVSSITYAACNQRVFDDIYKRITQQALTKPALRETYEEKNHAVGVLRELCNGQKSRYEETKEKK